MNRNMLFHVPLSSRPVSVEFKLLIELTHPAPALSQSDILSALQSSFFDNELFLQMLKWHRVIPQAYQRLAPLQDSLPADFVQKLKNMNMHCRMQSLRQSAWLAQIISLFRDKEIEFISLKGIGLSKQLYGESSYRQSHDIDILIDASDIDIVEEILINLGFARNFPPADVTPKQLRFLNKHKKDREYVNHSDGTIMEVHWRLTEVGHPFKPSLNQLLETGIAFSVHGEKATAVSGNYLWLYQSLHGSYSGWYRLRWICDMAQLLYHHKPDWNALIVRSEQHHCKNSLLEAIGMACMLYKLPIPEDIAPFLKQNKFVWNNINTCSGYLIQMKLMPAVPGIVRINFWAPKKSFIKYLFTHGFITPTDFSRFSLPDRLFFVYYFIRPVSFLNRLFITKKRESR